MSLYECIGNRDITDYVYRLIHQEYMRELNEEYISVEAYSEFLTSAYNAAYTRSSRSHGYFMFNYREYYSDSRIYNIVDTAVIERLSHNYWHTVLYGGDDTTE